MYKIMFDDVFVCLKCLSALLYFVYYHNVN